MKCEECGRENALSAAQFAKILSNQELRNELADLNADVGLLQMRRQTVPAPWLELRDALTAELLKRTQ